MATGARVVLASTSPYRRALLERLRIPFTVADPAVDETPLPGETPEHLVVRLAITKAEAVATTHADAVIVGSDQVVALDDEIITKPGTAERAREQLTQLAGRTHRLLTAVAVIGSPRGEPATHLDIHRLTMRALSADEIAAYVAADCPQDCAGANKIESLGIALMERIEGDDFTAITGLPLMATAQMLRAAGIAILGEPGA